MYFLKNIFGKNDEQRHSYEDFWGWFKKEGPFNFRHISRLHVSGEHRASLASKPGKFLNFNK